jgi:S-adenosylmethionine:tRNA ribosyltransferase-isomerase
MFRQLRFPKVPKLLMRVSDFDYELPAELIAQDPLPDRDASRMLIVNRATKSLGDSMFGSFPDYLRKNDVVVLNNTRVFPARLIGQRVSSGAKVELLLLREVGPNQWSALTRPARRLRPGSRLTFKGGRLHAEIIESLEDGVRIVRFESEESLMTVIDQIGKTPLPPYIKRAPDASNTDRERYQTIYAKERGAIAAPTAGLHFTKAVLGEIESRGARTAEITLHVGYGTFEPVRVDDVKQHRVAAEWFSISDETVQIVNNARAAGGRIVAVGTTTVRTLESSVRPDGRLKPGSGFSDLTIVPGHTFRCVDAMLTNFHLPKSSLLILVSAFAGHRLTLAAYTQAVRERYRFYSYGDCMLIL